MCLYVPSHLKIYFSFQEADRIEYDLNRSQFLQIAIYLFPQPDGLFYILYFIFVSTPEEFINAL